MVPYFQKILILRIISLKKALERKYKKEINLPELNDYEEMLAHERVKKKILREGKPKIKLSL